MTEVIGIASGSKFKAIEGSYSTHESQLGHEESLVVVEYMYCRGVRLFSTSEDPHRPSTWFHASPMNNKVDSSESHAIENEITELEKQLQEAKGRLNGRRSNGAAISSPPARLLQSDGK